MWFTNNSQSSVNYIKIKGLKKEFETHFFEVNWEPIDVNTFEGTLIGAKADSYEYEGSMKNTMKLLFEDSDGEQFQLDAGYNSITRSLLNSILGFMDANPPKTKMDIQLSLYISKAGYKQIWIKINGARAEWKWDIAAQKTMIETIVKKNGDKENDYFDYDKKLKESLSDIQAFIGEETKVEEKAPRKSNGEEIDVDNLPF